MKIARIALALVLLLAVSAASSGIAQALDPVPPPAGSFTYTVRWGDTLESIAARFGTTVQAIMQVNGLTSTYIYPGQQLIIPVGYYQPQYPSYTIYTVKWGDNLTSIAHRFGTTVEAIVQANNIYNPNFIYVGQRLLIPTYPQPYPPYPPQPASYYTVQRGDTLFWIAQRFGTTVWALVIANNLANPSWIYPGQVLIIPGGYYPPPPPQPTPPWPPYPTPCPWPGLCYPTPIPYPTPCPWPGLCDPTPTPYYPPSGWNVRIVSNTSGSQPTQEMRSVIRVSVTGSGPRRVVVSAGGWSASGITGTKPEYGPNVVEFASFGAGTYTITPDDLGISINVTVDGVGIIFVEFYPS